ncbi:PREDICTED: Retrovirus-related Pol poly from [Prunus dulcis]|uniref:PREDICTED: Retrovirus-related Pol poly from n=1 Tax=Prunus dulcis TaxID=3755 RepID=A0A5E4G1I1_PRUDU|nr:PREDICTED: Retrovirus-related Pol poly from [Prunus dulcis]
MQSLDAYPTPNNTDSPSPLPNRYKSVNKLIYGSTNHLLPHALTANIASTHTFEPTNYTQAAKYPQWQYVLQDEYDALIRNHTWSLIPATQSMNLVGCKRVFKIKWKADVSIERHKARLVAKEFNEKEGLDYDETFSPVVKPTTICTILSLALSHNWPLQQLDVRNAFLNGFLLEEVYMKQPPGFANPLRPNHVCKLHKELYGLKQAPLARFQRLTSYLIRQKFFHRHSDASLFIKHAHHHYVYVLVYVDNIIVTGSNAQSVVSFIDSLCFEFDSRRMGNLSFFLGMEIQRISENIYLSQT